MRVLVSSTTGHGHVLPMVPLARALRAARHDVLWAIGADARDLVTAAGLESAAAGLTRAETDRLRQEIVSQIGDVRPEDRGGLVYPRLFAGARVPAMTADLLEIAREWRPDLLLHEMGELACPLVGDVLGVPHVSHAFGTANPPDQLAAAAERVADLWRAHGRDVPAYAGCFEFLYLDICPPAVQVVPTGHIPRRQALRPGTYAGAEPTDVRSLVEDGTDRPLVYLTLGTVQNREPLFRELLDALATLDVRMLVTLGPGADPSVLGPQRPDVRIEAYVAQSAVLPLTDVVVSHAGSGTVLATLSQGIPQLCLPQAADQFRNAAGVERAGAGLALASAAAPAAVADAVRRLLTEVGFRDAAGRVRDEVASMPSPEEVVDALVALVADCG